MIKKHKYILVFFAMGLLFFLSADFSYALEVKDYPNLPGVSAPTDGCNPTDCLPNYVSYFFGLGIYLAGALTVISLAIGGIQYIFSGISPDSKNNAKERIIGSILGLVLTLSSFIILKTINPTLITPTLTPIATGAGIFYTNGSEEKQAPYSETDTSSIPAGYNTIIYKCSASGGGTGPALFVWKFPEKNFGGYKEAVTVRLSCGQKTSVDRPSFRMAFETEGVYYFTGAGCTGFMSQANLSNTQEIEEPFKNEMKSIKIINDTKGNINYGVVLHREVNLRGDCSMPLESYQQESKCHDTYPASSINIFRLNNNNLEASKTSGNGVVFYSKPFGYKTGSNSGYLNLSPIDIGAFWRGDPSLIDFSDSYNYISVPEGEKELCKNFKNCPGSIKVQGNYLIILYAQQRQNQNLYCQVFYEDVPNLKEEEVTAVEGRKLNLIYIIPIK